MQHNINLLIPVAKQKNLALRVQFDTNVPEILYGDELLLERIILNLLDNALNQGHVSLHAKQIAVDTKTQQALIELIVEDTGIGIPQNKLEYIFERDTRLNPAYPGTGSGLYRIRKSLDRIDGKIMVTSKINQGSKFILTVPFGLAHNNPIPNSSTPTMNSPIENSQGKSSSTLNNPMDKIQNNKRILLVEDQAIAAKIATHLFKTLGCHVQWAPTATAALSLLEEAHYDLILTDISLPGISGLEMTSKIRQDFSHHHAKIPVIGLSAYVDAEKQLDCLAAGMQTVLAKPLTAAKAEALLENYLGVTEPGT